MSLPSKKVAVSSSPLPGSEIVAVELTGHLTKAALVSALDAADSALASTAERIVLLVDCRSMTGYDTEAREYFVEWNKAARARVRRLAVVTERAMWQLVVSGMALASGQAMKAFDDRYSAERWLSSH